MVGNDISERRDELAESIRRNRTDLHAALHEVTGTARSLVTLSEHIRGAPLQWLLGALVVGVWLGTRTR